MPIESTHPKYKKYVNQWSRCRDVVDGSDAVKGKKETYLPKLTGQSTTDYNAYLKRALFFSVAGRSLQGLVGSITRRTPTIDKGGLDEFFKDVTLSNTSFVELFAESSSEVLLLGRFGMLVDVGVSGGRSYVATYTTESILNWRVNDLGQLTMLVLMEEVYEQDPQDKFELVLKRQYRNLEIVEGVYVVTVYDEDGDPIGSPIYPSVKGASMTFIPFVSVTPFGISIDPVKPPLLDIVDVNLSQYITSADLENGRHFTSLPTPVVTGAESDKALHIGGTEAWVIPNHQAKAYYLEFQGQGLESLEHAMKEKTGHMAQFSSRLMDTSTRGSEAVDAVKLRHSADSATLSGVAISLEAAFTLVYKYIALFEGSTEPSIDLNTDFLETKLTPAELKELTASYISGAIDEETYFYNLQRGELIEDGKSAMDGKKVSIKSDTGNSVDQD